MTIEETPICEHPLDNAYADMLTRSGMEFCTNDERLDFLAAMMKAHDAVKMRGKIESAQAAADPNDKTVFRSVMTPYLAAGESIIDLAAEGNYELPTFVREMAGNKPTIMETFDEERWGEIEDAIRNPPADGWTDRRLASKLGIQRSNAKSILRWYGHGLASDLKGVSYDGGS